MTSSIHETNHFLDAEIETEEQRQAFRVEDDSSATWAMRRFASVESKAKENKKIAEAEIQRINEWLESVNSSLNRSGEYFSQLLVDYARRQRDEDGRKSIVLPYGKVTSRSTKDKFAVNAELFLPWARISAPDLIRTKEEVALSNFPDAIVVHDGRVLTTQGEVVPGVAVTPGGVSYSVTTESVEAQ